MEFLFVSGSHSHFGKSVPDYHFKLNMSNSLPRPHSANPWTRTKISPLRDKLMINWLFSHREAMKELYTIITSLNQKIEESENSQPTELPSTLKSDDQNGRQQSLKKIIIGISCDNGYELSPCYVEKLYDHYNTTPPIDNLLVVKRQHTQLENRQIPREKFKWQQYSGSTACFRRKTESDNLQQIKQLTRSKDWEDLSQELSDRIEEAYQKDHLSNNYKIKDVVIDFESGQMTSLQTSQTAFLRCTVIPKEFHVKVRAINHQAYKVFVRAFEAAGILPYSVHSRTGEAVFLIGRLTYGNGTWCDFGGLKMKYKVLRETPSQTAARECHEESLDVFGSYDHLLSSLKSYQENNVFKIINEATMYVGHYLRIPFDHYPSKFATAVIEKLGKDDEYSVEMDSIRWVPLSELRKAVAQMQYTSACFIKVNPINEIDGSIDLKTLRLRREFVQSLCIADEYGILDSIENIARMVHSGLSVCQKPFPETNKKKKKSDNPSPPLVSKGEESTATSRVPPPSNDSLKQLIADLPSICLEKSNDYNLKSSELSVGSVQCVTSTNGKKNDGKTEVGVASKCNDGEANGGSVASQGNDDHHGYSSSGRRGKIFYGMISGNIVFNSFCEAD